MSDSAPVDGAASRSPLCGMIGCYPGNPSACGATPSVDAEAFSYYALALDASALEELDAASDGGGAVPPIFDASDAARLDASGDHLADAVGVESRDASIDRASDADADANEEPSVPESCQVKVEGDSVVSKCAPFGTGAAGSSCQDSSDCGANHACVEVNQQPVCRPFSCALPASCPAGNFYQQVPLRVAGVTLPGVSVPVCLPNDGCVLLSAVSACPRGQACAVVGVAGETSCVVPGSAQPGEPCDDPTHRCAEGLICSKNTNQCLKICHVGAGMSECAGGGCQGGNRSLPDGFGICVGGSPDGG